MKQSKHKTRLAVIMLMMLLAVCVLSACGANTGEAAIVGSWKETGSHTNKESIIFNKDGTWNYRDANGTWVLTEGKTNEIQMPSQSGLGRDTWHVGGVHEYSIEGNTLTLDGVGEFERE